jgi:hypothetical protein
VDIENYDQLGHRRWLYGYHFQTLALLFASLSAGA